MHEGEIGKSRARALICWPVNQCSLEDLVNISWLSFAFSFQIPSPYSSSFSQQLKVKRNKNRKNNTKKNQITHTIVPIQYSFYFHMPQLELHNCRRDIHFSESMGTHEYTRSPRDYWSNSFRPFLKTCIYYIFRWHLRKAYIMLLSLTNAPYSCQSMWGKKRKKKKKGWQCNISDFSTLLHSMFSLYASLTILPYVWFQK